MASVSGRRSMIVVPCPGTERMSIAPPSARTASCTASMPTPRPERSGHLLGGRESRAREQRSSSSSVRSVVCGVHEPVALGAREHALAVDAAPSSLTEMTTPDAIARRAQHEAPTAGFPAAARTAGASMPWSTALRSRCTSGVADLVEHRPIELDVLALDDEADLLAQRRAASRTRRGKRSNTCAHRHHAPGRDLVLQLGDEARRSPHRLVERGCRRSPASCVSRPRAITSSPMRFISVSRRRTSMRTWRAPGRSSARRRRRRRAGLTSPATARRRPTAAPARADALDLRQRRASSRNVNRSSKSSAFDMRCAAGSTARRPCPAPAR